MQFSFFRKDPELRIKLRGDKALVELRRIVPSQVVIALFSAIHQCAKMMNVDPRFLMNKIVECDKQIAKDKKQKEKDLRRDEFNAGIRPTP